MVHDIAHDAPAPPEGSNARIYTDEDDLCIELPPTHDTAHARHLYRLAGLVLTISVIMLFVGVALVQNFLLFATGYGLIAVGLTFATVAWIGRRTTTTIRLSAVRLRVDQKTPLGTSGREWQIEHLGDVTVRGSLHEGGKPTYALCVIDTSNSRTSLVDHRAQAEVTWARDVLLGALNRETVKRDGRIW